MAKLDAKEMKKEVCVQRNAPRLVVCSCDKEVHTERGSQVTLTCSRRQGLGYTPPRIPFSLLETTP